MLLENKITANSPAAGAAAGLAVLGEHYLHLDAGVAAPLATAVVVYVIALVVGYLVKHTNRPDLEGAVDEALGLAPLAPDEPAATDAAPAPAPADEDAAPAEVEEPAEPAEADEDALAASVDDASNTDAPAPVAESAPAPQPHLVGGN